MSSQLFFSTPLTWVSFPFLLPPEELGIGWSSLPWTCSNINILLYFAFRPHKTSTAPLHHYPKGSKRGIVCLNQSIWFNNHFKDFVRFKKQVVFDRIFINGDVWLLYRHLVANPIIEPSISSINSLYELQVCHNIYHHYSFNKYSQDIIFPRF